MSVAVAGRVMTRAIPLALVLAFATASITLGRFGSSLNNDCDATPASQCVASNSGHTVVKSSEVV
jgi:hypothetical protein